LSFALNTPRALLYLCLALCSGTFAVWLQAHDNHLFGFNSIYLHGPGLALFSFKLNITPCLTAALFSSILGLQRCLAYDMVFTPLSFKRNTLPCLAAALFSLILCI